MSFSLSYIQSRSRVGSGGHSRVEAVLCCALLCEYIFSSARFSSVQFSYSYSLLCFSFCFIFIVLPHSTRLPFFPLYRLALYLNRLELSRLVLPLSLSLLVSLSLSLSLFPRPKSSSSCSYSLAHPK